VQPAASLAGDKLLRCYSERVEESAAQTSPRLPDFSQVMTRWQRSRQSWLCGARASLVCGRRRCERWSQRHPRTGALRRSSLIAAW
jgi:hypothetical protein